MPELLGLYLGVITGIIVVILLLVILASRYVKPSSDTAFTISDPRKKTTIGKASIRIPFSERLDKLSLKLIPINVETSTAVPTADYVNIQMGATANVEIGGSPGGLAMAMKNFLNQNMEYIGHVAREMLRGNMREVMGCMKLKEIVGNHQKFAELVEKNAVPDLAVMGLSIISFNVRNFSDSNGIINDLSVDNISQVKKKATIAKTEAGREITVAKAGADRQTNSAKISSDRETAIKNNELDIQKVELKKNADIEQAEADVAYQIQEEQQRKTIEVTTAEASTAKQEEGAIIKQKMAKVAEKTLDTEIRKKAGTDKYAHQRKAEAEPYERQKNAEAKEFEVQREAKAQKSRAEAKRSTREQKAQGIRMADDAGAEAIQAKGVVEAGAMEGEVETRQKYTGTAVAETMIEVLSGVADKIAEPLA